MGNGSKGAFHERLQRRLPAGRTAVGRQCLAGTTRWEGRWGRTKVTGRTDRHATRTAPLLSASLGGGGGGLGGDGCYGIGGPSPERYEWVRRAHAHGISSL